MFRCALAIVMGTLLLMQQQPVAQTLLTIEDPEAYAVYAALLQRYVKHDAERMRNLRLLQETRAPTGSTCRQRAHPDKAWEAVLTNFWQANARRWLLKTGADIGIPYTLITPPEIQSVLKMVADDPSPRLGGGPEPGLRLLPARYLVFSAVGFSADKNFAVVGAEKDCDSLNPTDNSVLCSSGDVMPWERVGGQWVPAFNGLGCGWIA